MTEQRVQIADAVTPAPLITADTPCECGCRHGDHWSTFEITNGVKAENGGQCKTCPFDDTDEPECMRFRPVDPDLALVYRARQLVATASAAQDRLGWAEPSDPVETTHATVDLARVVASIAHELRSLTVDLAHDARERARGGDLS